MAGRAVAEFLDEYGGCMVQVIFNVFTHRDHRM